MSGWPRCDWCGRDGEGSIFYILDPFGFGYDISDAVTENVCLKCHREDKRNGRGPARPRKIHWVKDGKETR